MAGPQEDYDLDIKKLQYEKLQQETSWRGAGLPVASVIVGLVSVLIGGLNIYTGLRKDRQDHALACVNYAQNMLSIAQQQEAKILSMAPAGQPEYVDKLMRQFPPDAGMYLAQDLGMDKTITNPDVYNVIGQYSAELAQQRKGFLPNGVDCPVVANKS
jgi:hypothetical protein